MSIHTNIPATETVQPFDCSVLITVRNAEEFIANAIESVCAQSKELKLEIVLIDDGSTDLTGKVVNELPMPGHVELIYHYFPNGRSAALNQAVAFARAEYVAILDADDSFAPNKLARQLEIMNRNSFDLLATEFEIGHSIVPDYKWDSSQSASIHEITLSELIKGNPICHSSVLMKKSSARYATGRTRLLDLELWLRLHEEGMRLGLLPEKLTFKRIHDKQSFEARNKLSYYSESLMLSARHARPWWNFVPQLCYRFGKMLFQLLPIKLTLPIKKLIR